MVKVIEKATNLPELESICRRHNIIFIPQPTIILSKLAEKLYQINVDSKYAVLDADDKIELVEYNDEKELKDYGLKNKFEVAALVKKDGSGMFMPLK